MTRINCGIPPASLTDKHLMAEHREIKRIPNVVRRLWEEKRLSMKGQPDQFKLGTGHVKFFYDKLFYLKRRYESLFRECLRRGFNVTYYGGAWEGIPIELMNDYQPTDRDSRIVQQRINERLGV